VASLAGDVEVEEAAEYLFDHGIPAYPYSTEMPVAVPGAQYRLARGAGLFYRPDRRGRTGRAPGARACARLERRATKLDRPLHLLQPGVARWCRLRHLPLESLRDSRSHADSPSQLVASCPIPASSA